MSALTILLAFQVAAAPPPDTSLFPPHEALIRLYTNCDEPRWPYGIEETFVPKTAEELAAGTARRQALEPRWREWFSSHAGDSIAPTPTDAWIYPLTIRGRLIDNFLQPRATGPHEALDIFAPREGYAIRSPVSGVVIAAGDGWKGGWRRRTGLFYEGGGLSRRAGNGVLLFDPASGGYFYMVHMQAGSVLVHTGDVVRAGQLLGKVGHTGNASQPNHGRHLHLAFKQPGNACSVDGVLVAVNPYRWIRAARNRLGHAAH